MARLMRIVLAALAVLAVAAIVAAGTSAYRQWSGGSRRALRQGATFVGPVESGRIQNAAISESSGIVASRRTAGAYWTHNDSGARPYLYAMDEKGRDLGAFVVRGARNYDWEDIAIGPGPVDGKSYLFIGDIGDNLRQRKNVVVYRVAEPAIRTPSRPAPMSTEEATPIRLSYPDGAHDAEAMFVHPRTGDIYIITKTTDDSAGVYVARAPFADGSTVRMVRAGTLRISTLFGSLVTGADVSRDGRRVVLCNYISAFELTLSDPAASFDTLWMQGALSIPTPQRPQGEAICYSADGGAAVMTSEGARSPVWVVRQKKR